MMTMNRYLRNSSIRYETAHEFRKVSGYFQAKVKWIGFYMMLLEEYEFDNTNRLHL